MRSSKIWMRKMSPRRWCCSAETSGRSPVSSRVCCPVSTAVSQLAWAPSCSPVARNYRRTSLWDPIWESPWFTGATADTTTRWKSTKCGICKISFSKSRSTRKRTKEVFRNIRENWLTYENCLSVAKDF